MFGMSERQCAAHIGLSDGSIHQSPEAFLFLAVGHKGSTRVLWWIAFAGFRLREGQPVCAHGVVVPAFLPGDAPRPVLGPFRQSDLGR